MKKIAIEKMGQNKKISPLYVAFLAALGSGLEYYDFVIYGMMVQYLGEAFFPASTEFLRVIQTFSIFSVGYFARPIGGMFFGVLADSYGRKKAFITIMTLMAFSTFAIGCLPSYQFAGVLAPLMLVSFRLLQGISFGAELPSAATIISESSYKGTLGKVCGLVLSGTSLGALMATFMLTFLSSYFTYQEIITYAWRLPFFLGGALAFIASYIRKNVHETEEFLKEPPPNKRFLQEPKIVLRILKHHILSLLIAFGLTLFLATLIIINLYFPVFLSKYFDYSLPNIYKAMSVGMIFSFAFMLLLGILVDYVDKAQLFLYGMMGFILSIPLMYSLLEMQSAFSLRLFFISYQFWISLFFVNYLPMVTKLFPTKVRCTALSLTYNAAFSIASAIPTMATALFAGSTSPTFLLYFLGAALGMGFFSIYGFQQQKKALSL